jgi:REP element-mobilizing transposase RayT
MRLPAFDYTEPGPYFVTICLNAREPRFGSVQDGTVYLTTAGEAIRDIWIALPRRFPALMLDAFVLMPDHLHGILTLHDGTVDQAKVSLGDVIKAFKSESTTTYIHGVRQLGWPPFDGRFWQSNYYEHVIRNDRDLETKRAYIEGDPARWQEMHP